jgi:polyferredoxin
MYLLYGRTVVSCWACIYGVVGVLTRWAFFLLARRSLAPPPAFVSHIRLLEYIWTFVIYQVRLEGTLVAFLMVRATGSWGVIDGGLQCSL